MERGLLEARAGVIDFGDCGFFKIACISCYLMGVRELEKEADKQASFKMVDKYKTSAGGTK